MVIPFLFLLSSKWRTKFSIIELKTVKYFLLGIISYVDDLVLDWSRHFVDTLNTEQHNTLPPKPLPQQNTTLTKQNKIKHNTTQHNKKQKNHHIT